MSDTADTDTKLSLSGGAGKLELKKKIDLTKRPGTGSGKTVTVEVKRKRIGAPTGLPLGGASSGGGTLSARPALSPAPSTPAATSAPAAPSQPATPEPLRTVISVKPPEPIAPAPKVETPKPVAAATPAPAPRPAVAAPSAPESLRRITKSPVFSQPLVRTPQPTKEPRSVPASFGTPLVTRSGGDSSRRPAGAGAAPQQRMGTGSNNSQQRAKPVLSMPVRPGTTNLAAGQSIGNAPRGGADEPLKRVVRRLNEPSSTARPPASRPGGTARPGAPAARPDANALRTAMAPAKPGMGVNKTKRPDGKDDARRGEAPAKKDQLRLKSGKVRVVLSEGNEVVDASDLRSRSEASVRRQREKMRLKEDAGDRVKIQREITLPEVITVQDLANRMAERTADVVKTLMRMGVMATATQTLDADTAELVASELGHTVRRVSEADVEIGLGGDVDDGGTLLPRAPVVTIMGHVDHGKTSLLDALRSTDVVSGEAGGITQHIGAYKVRLASGKSIAFLDTPGHEAFTEMRARGANVTDIVVLVVAADDGIMPQTIEAIAHAKAAKVPIIVAINKVDKPGAAPDKVRTELLNHNLQVEQMGGDVQSVEVSAKKKINLDKLEEAILLQAEILDLRANPNRAGQGTVIEAKLDTGRGPVATVLVQRGTLRVGDIFVAGSEWGKIRAIVDEHGKRVKEAAPSTPVEVLGLSGVPEAGDDFVVVENEAKARQISEFRQEQRRKKLNLAVSKGSGMEALFAKIKVGTKKELAVVIKADVHGSLEALRTSLLKLKNDELAVQVLHGGVGGITEADITLAKASQAIVIGFNVRANPQARDVAKRDGIDIRYYSIIYDVIDDVKQVLGGMMAPMMREIFLGYAEIRKVFDVTKVGKVAGCYVTEGVIKRGCKVRLLRDNVVIHEGTLKTLKRLKDEVKEVKNNLECGMAFENYSDIREGDQIECFEVQSEARAFA
ncbi:MAG: translation initiation factor IF-2 [Alphaproteobacteria bacterium]|nr:translation initiation factor IF-2 [Alphaproteobacteria bacterium]